MEKVTKSKELPLPSSTSADRAQPWQTKLIGFTVLALVLFNARSLLSCANIKLPCTKDYIPAKAVESLCPQAGVIVPTKNAELWASFDIDLKSNEFQKKAVDWLAGAVREPTESYDNQAPPGVDDRWKTFDGLHSYLKGAFPLTYSKLEVTTVNTYGLVFHWQGSSDTLKPLLLTAHQDVVPVDPKTVDQWKFPPYSGSFDGENVWGRGSDDDKSGLVGILTVFESFLEKGFRPTRSIVAAFGYDEESAGKYGAAALADFLENKYGKDAFVFIVDEGGSINEHYGVDFAIPAIAEKGYLDLHVRVESPGGHSSIPPAHTSIGMLSALLVHYENNPTPFVLERANPVYEMLQCFAAHGQTMDTRQRSLVLSSTSSDRALQKLSQSVEAGDFGLDVRALTTTTQAIDIISGGVKANALPEGAVALINHRIAVTSSVKDLIQRTETVFKDLAHRLNLTFTSFGETVSAGPSKGSLITSDDWNSALESAPISPTDAAEYHLLAGTIRATYNTHRGLEDGEKPVIVSPGIMSGNTDTKHYWNLSRHIYRYNHRYYGKDEHLSGIHTINERIPLNTYLETIRFFATLILNVDEASL